MVAYAKRQQRKKEEGEKLRGERDEIEFIDLRFERCLPSYNHICQILSAFL